MAKIQNFNIYLKDGRNFQIKNVSFEIKDETNTLIFSNDSGVISDYIYLKLSEVAAIIPEQSQNNGQSYFDVYLKEREFKVFGERFMVTESQKLNFYRDQHYAIKPLYIDLSEVIAINLINPE